MKALSFRQPWAGSAYRGPVLLHARKNRHLGEFDDAVDFAVLGQERRREPLWRPAPTLPLGGIVGRARIVGVQRQGAVCVECEGPTTEAFSPWYAGGFALVLADVEPLPFIPWKGSLGFFDVPDDLISQALAREIRGLAPC